MKNEPRVFENTKPKQKAFLAQFLKITILLSILAIIALAKKVSADPTSMTTLVTVAMVFAIVLCIGIAFGIREALKAQKIIVKVTDEDVDVTVGNAHGVYPVKDYLGMNVTDTGNNYKKFQLELVFANPESEDNLYVALPGIKRWLFTQIADYIQTKKHDKYDADEEYEAFEGDLFEGEVVEPFAGNPVKTLLKLLMFQLAIIGLVVLIFVFFKLKVTTAKIITFSILAGIGITINIVWIIITPKLNKRSLDNQISTLRFEDYGLKINDVEYAYRNIKSITMTPPYLPGLADEFRTMTIEMKHSDEKKVFNLMLRPKKDDTEELVAAGCSCTYPALYERIKTDPGTAGLFRE